MIYLISQSKEPGTAEREIKELWFSSWQGFFLFSEKFRLALGPSQPSIQRVQGAFCEDKQAGT